MQIPGQVPPGFEQLVGHFSVGVGVEVCVNVAVGVLPLVGLGDGVGELVGVAVLPPVVGAAATGTSMETPTDAGVGAINGAVGVGDGDAAGEVVGVGGTGSGGVGSWNLSKV